MNIGKLVLACIFLCACNNNVPFGTLGQTDMENILWEQIQADVYCTYAHTQNPQLDASLINVTAQQQIFKKYKTDRKTFYKSYQFYIKHEELLKPLIDSIVAKQTRIKEVETIKKYQSKQKINWQAPFNYQPLKQLPPYKLNKIFIERDSSAMFPNVNLLKQQHNIFNKKRKSKAAEYTAI